MVVKPQAQGAGTGQGVGGDDGACVVFHAVNAIGVRGQGPHSALALQGLSQAHAELARAAAPAFGSALGPGAHRNGGFTARQQHTGARKRGTALGFEPEELPRLWGVEGLEVTRWGTIKADYQTHSTSLPGVYAVGDIVRGASLVVWAIRDGREAADSIANWLSDAARVAAE